MQIPVVNRGMAGTLAAGYEQNGTGSANASSADLDYDAFLQLLIAQMQNQDPMEPMKSTDYVAQLATFSQVEKSVQTNERISELLSAVRIQQAEALVGSTLESADGTVSGVVASTRIYQDGIVAVLEDGREIVVGPGVSISRGPQA